MSAEACSSCTAGEASVVRRSVGPEGKRVSYLTARETRDREPILLIHGAGVSARSWTNQVQGLSHALRVVAIDLPGHGESAPIAEASVEAYADVAHDLLDALGTGPVFAAGHSLGGAVAQALAARHPEAVKGLVLVSTCARLPERESAVGRTLWLLPGPLRKILFFSLAKKMLFAPGAPGEAILLGMEELRMCRPETILKDVAAGRAMDLEEAARRLRVPALVLCGSRDKLTPPPLSERLNELIPGSRLSVVEGAGHMLPLEAPERVNREILEFVGSVARIEEYVPPAVAGARKQSLLRRLLEKGREILRGGGAR